MCSYCSYQRITHWLEYIYADPCECQYLSPPTQTNSVCTHNTTTTTTTTTTNVKHQSADTVMLTVTHTTICHKLQSQQLKLYMGIWLDESFSYTLGITMGCYTTHLFYLTRCSLQMTSLSLVLTYDVRWRQGIHHPSKWHVGCVLRSSTMLYHHPVGQYARTYHYTPPEAFYKEFYDLFGDGMSLMAQCPIEPPFR